MNIEANAKTLHDAPLHRLESQLCFALYSVTNAVGRTYAPLLEALGLTYSQYIAMLVLWEQDDLSVSAIGKRLFLDSGTLTPLLKRLEQAGLIARRRDPADERQVRIRLTAAGDALREHARGLPHELGCAMGRAPDDLAALRDDLLRLRSNLMASLEGASAGIAPAPSDVQPAAQAAVPPPLRAGTTVTEGENDAR